MVARTPLPVPGESSAEVEKAYVDGWADLNSRIRRGEPWSGNERNAAFLSVRDGADRLDMVDVAPLLGLDDPGDGRSAARIDIDFDGDDDLVLTQRTAPRLRIMRGALADDSLHLAVQLEGTRSNREGVGATVFATPIEDEPSGPRRVHSRSRTAGSGYLAQSSAWLRFHFGARAEGQRAPRARLQVRWPGVGADRFEDFGEVRLGRSYLLREGAGTPIELNRPAPVELAARPIPEADPEEPLRVALPVFSSSASIDVRSPDGRRTAMFGLTSAGPRGVGRPAVAIVLDSRDPSSIERLGDLAALSADARRGSVPLFAVDVAGLLDPSAPDRLPFAETMLAAAGWSGEVLAGEGDTLVVLEEFFAWRLGREQAPALPWSFVFDPEGRISHMRTAPWAEGQLGEDLTLILESVDLRRVVAAPFGGRWLDPPGPVDLAGLKARLDARGAEEAARELGLARVETTRALDALDATLRLGLAQLRSGQLENAEASFRKALESRPDSLQAEQGLALTFQAAGRQAEAYDAWSRALVLAPADRTTLTNHALIAISLDDLEAAAADLEVLGRQGAAAAGAVERIRLELVAKRRELEGKGDGGDPNEGGNRVP